MMIELSTSNINYSHQLLNNPSQQILSFQLKQHKIVNQFQLLNYQPMGNSQQYKLDLLHTLTSNNPSSLPSSLPGQFIIKEIVTHSPQQYHQLILSLNKFKLYQCPHVLRLVDSHTVETHNLCSIISHVYAVIEQPSYRLDQFLGKLGKMTPQKWSKVIQKILQGCVRGLSYLKKQCNQVNRIKMEHIYVEDDEKGQFLIKIMNPFFIEPEFDLQQDDSGVIKDLGLILSQFIDEDMHPSGLVQTVQLMTKSQFTLQQLEQKVCPKKTKTRIRLTRDNNKQRIKRESVVSAVSSGSSLMIDAGNQSENLLYSLYEDFDDQFSQSSITTMNNLLQISMTNEDNISHQFPKKYLLKGQAFKKTTKRGLTQWSEAKSEQKQNITRDQSLKQNINAEPKGIRLHSAKLVESFIGSMIFD